MKTREEVEALKRQWLDDPCWDIWTTENFDEYRDELENFAVRREEIWKEQRDGRHFRRSRKLKCSPELVNLIELLEYKIELLQERVNSLENKED